MESEPGAALLVLVEKLSMTETTCTDLLLMVL